MANQHKLSTFQSMERADRFIASFLSTRHDSFPLLFVVIVVRCWPSSVLHIHEKNLIVRLTRWGRGGVRGEEAFLIELIEYFKALALNGHSHPNSILGRKFAAKKAVKTILFGYF